MYTCTLATLVTKSVAWTHIISCEPSQSFILHYYIDVFYSFTTYYLFLKLHKMIIITIMIMNAHSASPAQALSAYTFFTNSNKIQHIQHEHTQAHMHTHTKQVSR